MIEERVRSELGRAVSHPGAITVTSRQGRVTLTGAIVANEVKDLVTAVQSVRGVREIEDRLEGHRSGEGIPGLQGAGQLPRARPDGSTRIDIRLSCSPPAGAIGQVVASLLRSDPKRAMDQDLLRLKSLLEQDKATADGGTITREALDTAPEPATT